MQIIKVGLHFKQQMQNVVKDTAVAVAQSSRLLFYLSLVLRGKICVKFLLPFSLSTEYNIHIRSAPVAKTIN